MIFIVDDKGDGNMILASFDLSFFTSIPGMLITGGVLLLLIALIIFIATGSKGKKKDKTNKEEETNKAGENSDVMATPNVNIPVATAGPTVTASVSGINPVTPDVTPTVVEAKANPSVSTQPKLEPTPVMPDMATPNVVMPSIDTNTNMNNNPSNISHTVNPNVNPSNTVSPANDNNITNSNAVETQVIPSIEPQTQIIEESKPINMNTELNKENTITPTVESIASSATLVSQSEPVSIVGAVPPKVEESKPIYGGVSSVIPNIAVDNNQHRPIYGGANPLENTQNIPIANANSNISNSTVSNVEITPKEAAVPSITPIADSKVTPEPSEINPTVNSTVSVPNSAVPSGEEEIESLF
ncbi:MAG TPA: hypothetical protein IAB45_01135 [Candidatus Onthousia faecavium]|nr:hypothetical protein [Candidatus Onthousia faecavium]